MVRNSIVNALGCLTLITLLSGCLGNTPVQEIQVSAKPIEKPELVLPTADRLVSRDIKWTIITPDNYEEVFAELESSGQQVVLFGLTDKGYENLALNLSDIRAYIQQQHAIIAAYEGYYQQTNAAIDAANEEINNTN